MADEQAVYHPIDAIAFTTSTTFQIGMAGVAVAAVQNALRKDNIGAMGVFSRTGGTIGTFGTDVELLQMGARLDIEVLTAAIVSVGAAYSFTRAASANLREKDDHWNATIGGFFGGAVGGLRREFAAASLLQTRLQFEQHLRLDR